MQTRAKDSVQALLDGRYLSLLPRLVKLLPGSCSPVAAESYQTPKAARNISYLVQSQNLRRNERELLPKLTQSLNFVSIRTKINYVVNSRPSVTWMFQGVSSNKLAHMLNGNKSRSYNIGMWNCRKGLTNSENLPTGKIVDLKEFLESNELQLLCLIEADLHGVTSRVRRVKSGE